MIILKRNLIARNNSLLRMMVINSRESPCPNRKLFDTSSSFMKDGFLGYLICYIKIRGYSTSTEERKNDEQRTGNDWIGTRRGLFQSNIPGFPWIYWGTSQRIQVSITTIRDQVSGICKIKVRTVRWNDPGLISLGFLIHRLQIVKW